MADSFAGLIHLIENPALPSLSFDIISHDVPGVVGEGSTQEGEREELKDQYIPSFYNRGELNSWIDDREERYT